MVHSFQQQRDFAIGANLHPIKWVASWTRLYRLWCHSFRRSATSLARTGGSWNWVLTCLKYCKISSWKTSRSRSWDYLPRMYLNSPISTVQFIDISMILMAQTLSSAEASLGEGEGENLFSLSSPSALYISLSPIFPIIPRSLCGGERAQIKRI